MISGLNYSKGSSLLQMLLLSTALSAAILSVTKMMTLNSKISKSVEVKSRIRAYKHMLNGVFSDSESCLSNFLVESRPSLRDDKIVYKVFGDGPTRSGFPYFQISSTSDRRVTFKSMILKLSSLDIDKYGFVGIDATSLDKSNYGEIEFKVELDLAKNSFLPVKKVFSIPLVMNYAPSGKLLSCFSYPDNKASLYSYISSAVEKLCPEDTVYNNNPLDPMCVPIIANGVKNVLAECKEGQYIKSIFYKNEGGKLVSKSICASLFCDGGEFGIWKNGIFSCKKCAPNEFLIYTSSGPVCSALDCSKSGDIRYFAGIQKDGTPICKLLVDVSNPYCGENGFQLVSSSSGGSVGSSCCKDCKNQSRVCEGQLAELTSDCNIRCEGTKKRKDMTYSSWGSCKKENIDGKGICVRRKTGKCNNMDSKGYPCCHTGQEYQVISESCYNSGWSIGDCSVDERSYEYKIEPTCESGKCCNPKDRPNSKICRALMYQGVNPYSACLNSGGIIKKAFGHTFCHFPSGDCKGGLTPYKQIYGEASGSGSKHWSCFHVSSCHAGTTNDWTWPHDRPQCRYAGYRYFVGLFNCDERDWRTAYGAIRESLCY